MRQARSLRQALRMLDDLVPDVAVIDIGLPDGSGLDVLRRLRCGADRLDSGTPVLVLTAPHRGGRRPARLRARRRRLPAQAVRAARVDRPRARAARTRAPRCRPTSASAICCSSLPRAARAGPAASCRSRAASTTCCSSSRAIRARCAPRPICCARSGACRRRLRTRTVDSHASRLRRKLVAAGAPSDPIVNEWGRGYRLEVARAL